MPHMIALPAASLVSTDMLPIQHFLQWLGRQDRGFNAKLCIWFNKYRLQGRALQLEGYKG
jgi:hypothetical protein